MFDEALDVFLSDFGVSVSAGAVSGTGILDMPSQVIADGMVISTDYRLTVKTVSFGALAFGDAVTIDGVAYQVRESYKIDDGAFTELSLTRLAPDAVAAGSQLRQFGIDDLADVELQNPEEGEVLRFDGSKWKDAANVGAAYVHTQSVALGTWIINHNLGYRPSVEVFNSASQEVDADVQNPTINQTLILFTMPISGFARLT